MKKTFVLDTSVILYDPQCIYRFDDNNSIFVKGLYSKFSDSEQRYVTTPSFFASGRSEPLASWSHSCRVKGRRNSDACWRVMTK